MNRVFLTKLHLLLAAFMFPVILMFLGTGALYTWGETGKTVDTKTEITLSAPLDPENKDALRAVAAAELAKAGLDEPTGKSRVRKVGGSFAYEWTGSRRDIVIEPTDDPLVAKVAIKEASPHRVLVQLHKAKGSTLFKVYATALAVVLFLLVVTGVVLGLQVKLYRRMTIIGSLAGLAFFAGIVAVS